MRRIPNRESAKLALQRTLRRAGIDAARLTLGDGLFAEDRATVRAVEKYTMTSPERIAAVCDAIHYLCRNGLGGDIVECGVWRGGSMMAAARTLLAEGSRNRRLYLYDTYTGMADPTERDRDLRGTPAVSGMRRYGRDAEGHSRWCYASIHQVRANLASTGYPVEQMTFVRGKVEETIPETMPGRIGLLRLDTDWYESTAHALKHLFPLLVPGGVLILDDYGHWKGARRAVDEYFEANRVPLLLSRIDYTGRVAVRPGLQA